MFQFILTIACEIGEFPVSLGGRGKGAPDGISNVSKVTRRGKGGGRQDLNCLPPESVGRASPRGSSHSQVKGWIYLTLNVNMPHLT